MATRRMRRILVVALVVIVAVVVVLLLPPVQTALVRSVVGGIDGLNFHVDRVWAGPWGAEVEGLEIVAGPVDLGVDRLEADLAFWSSLGHLSLDVEQATVSGVDLRLEPLSLDGDEGTEPVEFHGLASLARLPKRLIVRRADVEGTVAVFLAGGLSVVGPWNATASDVGPDRRLSATVDSTLETSRAEEILLAARVVAKVEAGTDDDAALRTISAEGQIRSLGQEPEGLDALVSLDLADTSETYSLTVNGSEKHRLLEVHAGFEPETDAINVAWEATTTEGLVAAFAVGDARPDLWGSTLGTAVLDLQTYHLDIEANARVESREWGKLDPRLADWVGLDLELDVAGVLSRGQIDVRKLRLGLIPAGDREILKVEALGPLTVDFETLAVIPETWGEPAIRIEMNRFPLDWVRRFKPVMVVVEEGVVDAVLDVVPLDVRHGRLVAREPIRAEGLKLSPGKLGLRPLPVDVIIVPRMEYERGQLEAEIERFEMTAATGLRVQFEGQAATSLEQWPSIDLNGFLAMRIPKLRAAIDSLDAVGGNAQFALDLGMHTMALDSAVFGARDVTGRPLIKFEFENEIPLSIALPSMVADWEASSTQELNILFDGLPIGWISPFVPELEFEEGALYGELEAAAGGGRGLTLSPVEPFQIRGLKPIYRGIVVSEDTTVSLEPHIRLDNTTARVSLDAISVRTTDRGRLDGQVTLRAPRDGRGRIDTELWFEGDFPAITRRIGRIGALSWRQQSVVDVVNRRVEVTELELGLTDLAGTRFLELESVRPFVLSADPFGVWVDDGSPDILVATVTPLELQQLFPQAFGFELEGVLPQGQFLGRAENGGLLFLADDELVFKDVNVRWEEAALLDRVTVGLTYEVLYSSDGLQARSIDFTTLGPRGTLIAEATLRAVMPLTDRTTIEDLHFETVANLEPLTRQPIFDGLPAFLEGTIGGAMDLTYGEDSSIRGDLHLRGAQVENQGALPDADAGLDLRAMGDHSLTVRAPLRLSSENGVSDLSFEGGVERVGESFVFDAALTGDRIVAEDVTQLVHLVSPLDPDASLQDLREPVSSAFRQRWSKPAIAQLREQRDTEPFWSDQVSGTARLEIGTIVFPRYSMDGIRGRLEVDPGAIDVTGVEAELLGARFAADGAIRFDGAAELPYDLQFSSSFVDFDLGRLFQAVNPEEPPTLEGIYAVHTTALGSGSNPADLGLGTLGEVRVSGRDGVFRGMAGQYTLARRGTKVLGFLTFSKQLKAVSRLLGELEALEFDTFDLVLARETPRRFAISELTVVAPLARIEGSGGVEVEPGVPLVESPLDVSLEMATQGDMTILFNGLGLLREETDEHGYRPLTRPVTVGGTVSEPDTSDFYEMLDEAATDSKGVLGVGMRRANKKLQKAQAKKP